MEASPSVIAAAAAVIFATALLSSIAGFAFCALASAPLMLLLGDPVRVVAAMVACSVATQAYGAWALRRDIVWQRLWPFLAGGVLTVPAGVWLLERTPPAAFGFGIGLFLTAYAIYRFCRVEPPVLRAGWRKDAAVGALGGVCAGVAGLPGLAVTIWCGMRGWSKEAQRAVYQPFILAMQLETLACLGARSPAALALETLLVYVPLALAAACLGLAVFRRLTTRQFTAAVNSLLLASGVAALLGASSSFSVA